MLDINQSLVSIFYFEGLTNSASMNKALFTLLLALYVFIIMGNGGIIFLITSSCHLHTPMYFFLKHLSFIDICYSSVIIPRLMSDLLSGDKSIPVIACAVQMFFYSFFAVSECLLLVVMSYDRYAAICEPLLYNVIMRSKICIFMTVSCYVDSFLSSMINTSNIFSLIYCKSNKIAHFFCDGPPILELSCSNTSFTKLVVFALVGIHGIVSLFFFFIAISYTRIAFTILKIKSTKGREKAFATCSSHLFSIGILFGTLMYMYMRPVSSYSRGQDTVLSIFYTVVTPMLNPVIYSLRNKDVKKAFLQVSF